MERDARIPAAAAAAIRRRGLATPAAALVWLASAGEGRVRWVGGRLCEAPGGKSDDPAVPVPGEGFAGAAPPERILRAAAAVDAALPPREALLRAVAGRTMVLTPDPAAARVPLGADVSEAAACLVACRALLAVGEATVPPAFSADGHALAVLEDASLSIIEIVGAPVVEAARSIASLPAMWAPVPADDLFASSPIEEMPS